jgi:hypothetical protein
MLNLDCMVQRIQRTVEHLVPDETIGTTLRTTIPVDVKEPLRHPLGTASTNDQPNT